mmetsp:Transcript_27128/g.48680  ORF Transcript_27128/g.48680 Transcript_27128/m.48680 type:complete len:237 (+) Transcript_27128:1351-2061(+)
MSERRESNADTKYERLTEFECGKRVEVPSEDPLGLYNHLVKQYNAPCNRSGDSVLDNIPESSFYSFWMKRWWTRLRADQNIGFVVFSLVVSFVVGFIPLFNLIHFCFWLVVWLLYERAAKKHRENLEKVNFPFENMIFAPVVCERGNLMNVYYDIPVAQLKTFGLRPEQVDRLTPRARNGTVAFMVYNKRFRAAWTMFGFLRVFHILNILLVITAIILANVWLYPAVGISEIFISL